jgi:hypothetical protein
MDDNRLKKRRKLNRFMTTTMSPRDWLKTGLICFLAFVIGLYVHTAVLVFKPWERFQTPSLTREYALWEEPHNTTALLVDWGNLDASRVATGLDIVFRAHLRKHLRMSCICFHHLNMKKAPRINLCAVRTPRILMGNVEIVGHSGNDMEGILYEEYSVTCAQKPNHVVRYSSVVVKWIDPVRNSSMVQVFDGDTAACLQLAVDEMSPHDNHCQRVTSPHRLKPAQLEMPKLPTMPENDYTLDPIEEETIKD